MTPSLSTIERGNPPPRRKSCAACIKAKRRCDLRQPSCLRCSQRRIDCSYPVPPHDRRRGNDNGSTSSSMTSSSSSSPSGTSPNVQQNQHQQVQPQEFMMRDLSFAEPSATSGSSLSWDSGFDFNIDLCSSYHDACPSYPNLSFDDPPGFQGLEFLDDDVMVMGHQQQQHNPVPVEFPMPPTPDGPTLDVGLVEEPMPLVPRPPPMLIPGVSRIQVLRAAAELKEKRLRYTIDAFKRAPEEMVLECGTAWSHPALYRDSMPRCLEDALTACALHRAKNQTNTPMIQRVIQERYTRLLQTPSPSPSSPQANPREMLARTHAILLYQIMLFFDESSRTARLLTQETMTALSDSARSLLSFARYERETDSASDCEDNGDGGSTRNIPLYPLTAARALYNDWTFQESLRRTLLVSFLFTQLQSLLRADFTSLISQSFTPTPHDAAACFAPSDASLPDGSAMAVIRQALVEQASPVYTTNDTEEDEEGVEKAEEAERKKSKDLGNGDAQMLLCQSFTLSAHLWNARDPVDFAVAWRDKRHFVVQPWNVWKRIDSAQADDIDQLGRIIMTSAMGIEEAKGWFASRGGKL
ncbi:hypothetical protein F5Y03DRAFT_359184 [Xylaria venustula]|nr:hypothetical protein F5Y03DRAFT_359184 [Xylaria venustula]